MAEKFIATFLPSRTNPYIEALSELSVITGITKKKGLDPERCLFRGFTGEEAVKRALQTGDDAKHPTNSTFLIGMRRKGNGYEFAGNGYTDTPLEYTDVYSNPIAALAVYNRDLLIAGGLEFSWRFKDGVSAKDALLGVIILTNEKTLQTDRRKFNQFIANARRMINQ